MTNIDPGKERVYEGTFFIHWDVPRFCYDTCIKRFGLFRIRERWELHLPPGFELPWAEEFGGKSSDEQHRHSNGRLFSMSFRGVVSPKGSYGHMGFCQRKAT